MGLKASPSNSSGHTGGLGIPILQRFQNPADFERYSVSRWACKICTRESLKHVFLMTPEMAIHHERSAYHRHNTSGTHYQLKSFSEEPNTAWDGPSRIDDTFAWLRDKEQMEYNTRREAAWLENNKDWNNYNPDEDEFLHPNKRIAGRPYTSRTHRKPRGTKRKDIEDNDTVKVIRRGVGYFTHDPVPKPEVDVVAWLKGSNQASGLHESEVTLGDWSRGHASWTPGLEEVPLPMKVTEDLLQFGLEFSQQVGLEPKKTEFMHLFLEVGHGRLRG
ncbi:hypothetical protein FRC15_001413 [Serendipita sp. 397]|nr:hypothetical protein FRC15_001413 [Serendipita sp. 397]